MSSLKASKSSMNMRSRKTLRTNKQCLATRLGGSTLQYFDSVRNIEIAYDCMDKLIEAFKARFIETSSTE